VAVALEMVLATAREIRRASNAATQGRVKGAVLAVEAWKGKKQTRRSLQQSWQWQRLVQWRQAPRPQQQHHQMMMRRTKKNESGAIKCA
jgi:hypothetical protein